MKDFFKRHFGLAHHTGFVLVLSLFIILGFFVLAMVAIAIMAAGTDIYVKELNSAQAFYLAEAARNYALEYYISYGSNFTDTNSYPNPIPTRTLGAGTFTINIATPRQIKTADITFSGIVAIGPDQNIIRRIYQSYNGTTNLPSSLSNYAFVSLYNQNETRLSGTIIISNNNGIGDCYFNNNTSLGLNDQDPPVCQSGPTITGNVDINGNAYFGRTTLNGNLRAAGNLDTTCNYNSGTYTANGNVSPFPTPPAKPAINTTYYDNEINRAQTNPDYFSSALGTVGGSLDLGGRNYYRNGSLTINGTITGGPANIVATNFIEVNTNARIRGRINLISRKAISTISQNVHIGGTWNGTNMVGAGAILYAAIDPNEEVSIYSNGAVSPNLVRIKGALLTPTPISERFRTIHLNGNTSLDGVVYGKGLPQYFGTVRGSVVVDGPIYEGGGSIYGAPFHTLKGANITYNSSFIPLSIKGLYSCSRGAWQELSQ